MKKKLLLIFFIVLIVIFLILFINKSDNINEIVNNTINNSEEYKITLTLKNIYYINGEKINSKITYTEEKEKDLYKFTKKIYDNDTLTKETINYLDKNKYYYKENNKYKTKDIKNIDSVKDFKINYTRFFNKIKNLSRTKVEEDKIYYKTKMKSEDAFSLIYDNSKNKDLEKYTYVTLISNKNDIEEVSFKVKDNTNNTYYVKLNLDIGLQTIKLDIK